MEIFDIYNIYNGDISEYSSDRTTRLACDTRENCAETISSGFSFDYEESNGFSFSS